MALIDRRFFLINKDKKRIYPRLMRSRTNPNALVYDVSKLRNAKGHGREVDNLDELKRLVLEEGWRFRGYADEKTHGSYARHGHSIIDHGEDRNAPIPTAQSGAILHSRSQTKAKSSLAVVGARGGETNFRAGQGAWREELHGLWGASCAVTGLDDNSLLNASHIVPVRAGTKESELDVSNGLPLIPALDLLFDRRLMTFSDSGKMRFSKWLTKEHLELLAVQAEWRLTNSSSKLRAYLSQHRDLWYASEEIDRRLDKANGDSYRVGLLRMWGNCCGVTGLKLPKLLVASHAVPRRDCSDFERTDPANGVPLTPNLDRLFDRYLISFDDRGEISISRRLKKHQCEILGVTSDMKLRIIPSKSRPYLTRHYENFTKRESLRA